MDIPSSCGGCIANVICDMKLGNKGKQCVLFNKRLNSISVTCECGNHIALLGKRDYKFINGKYYCVDCM